MENLRLPEAALLSTMDLADQRKEPRGGTVQDYFEWECEIDGRTSHPGWKDTLFFPFVVVSIVVTVPFYYARDVLRERFTRKATEELQNGVDRVS